MNSKNKFYKTIKILEHFSVLLLSETLKQNEYKMQELNHALALWSDRIQDTPEIPENKKIRSINLYF